MHLEIFVDQARPWQPPECSAYRSKYGKRRGFEVARDVRVLKDLQGIDLARTHELRNTG